jgi:hypothetical protein
MKTLTNEQVTKLALALNVIGLLGTTEEARSRYRDLVATVGDAEAARVLRAARRLV